jgi:small GTP-binding protein
MAVAREFKITLVGEAGVGKTCIVNRYVGGTFDPEEEATVGCACCSKEVVRPDGEPLTLSIWDTAGAERHRSVVPTYYRGSHACIVVYDLSQPESVDSLRYWFDELSSIINSPDGLQTVPILLLGNKSDLKNDGKAWLEAQQFAENNNVAHHYGASALTGENVNEVFEALIPDILKYAEGVMAPVLDPVMADGGSQPSGCC